MAVLPNKAQLPTGIAAVRPHLEQVDNVPLLVGLITDCTPEASLQMLEIMQEYGELVLAVGSSLSIVNTSVFLQADISISVLPVGDWQCSMSSGPNWQTVKNATDSLMSIASDFRLRFEQVFLTTFVELPLLTLGSVFTPFRPRSNVIRISSKNSATVPRRDIKWATITFFIVFFPSSLFLVLFFFLLLIRNSTVTCSFSDVVCAVAAEHARDAPLSTMAIRHVVGLHVSVFFLLQCHSNRFRSHRLSFPMHT
ncbi:hypothetical protein COOONC_17901 [Cooperia oncophora]